MEGFFTAHPLLGGNAEEIATLSTFPYFHDDTSLSKISTLYLVFDRGGSCFDVGILKGEGELRELRKEKFRLEVPHLLNRRKQFSPEECRHDFWQQHAQNIVERKIHSVACHLTHTQIRSHNP